MSGMNELRELNDKLTEMLDTDNAYPGLVTWRLELSELLKQMFDYAGYVLTKELIEDAQEYRDE